VTLFDQTSFAERAAAFKKLLADPDHARAYQILCDHPRGSTHAWAKLADWTQHKMWRFVRDLKNAGLCELTPIGRKQSLFERIPLNHVDTHRNVSIRIETPPDVKALDLDVTASRCAGAVEKPGKSWPRRPIKPVPGTAELIEALNDAMTRRFEDFEPISFDNDGSLHAAKYILVTAKVPLEEAIKLIRIRADVYNPEKIGGDLPYSLGHPWFSKHLVAEWRRIKRDREAGQEEMRLLGSEKNNAPKPATQDDPSELELMRGAMEDLKRRLAEAEAPAKTRLAIL
jgi:hypothetical protein